MDSNKTQLYNPPDLPGLESVEVNRKAVMGIFVMPFTLIAMVFVVFIMTSLLSGKVLVEAVPILVMLLIIAIWLIYRLLTEIYYFKTDADGLHAKTIIGKRFIRWSDVTSADIIYGIGSSVTYQLSTSDGKLSIPSAITGYFRPRHIASI